MVLWLVNVWWVNEKLGAGGRFVGVVRPRRNRIDERTTTNDNKVQPVRTRNWTVLLPSHPPETTFSLTTAIPRLAYISKDCPTRLRALNSYQHDQ